MHYVACDELYIADNLKGAYYSACDGAIWATNG